MKQFNDLYIIRETGKDIYLLCGLPAAGHEASGKKLVDAAILYMLDKLNTADADILINMLKDQIRKGKRR